jgi:branched-subunit amino acid ABC-type transport system permease component
MKQRRPTVRDITLIGVWAALAFGVKLVLFGPVYALTYLISGIPFDLAHGAANFVTALFLFRPLVDRLERLRRKNFTE